MCESLKELFDSKDKDNIVLACHIYSGLYRFEKIAFFRYYSKWIKTNFWILQEGFPPESILDISFKVFEEHVKEVLKNSESVEYFQSGHHKFNCEEVFSRRRNTYFNYYDTYEDDIYDDYEDWLEEQRRDYEDTMQIEEDKLLGIKKKY